ncbi:MAG: HdeD family acid-resistance protein [Ketobacteraceae bacterium]|nr:HdeD family acid-resistance protein [Ketobacteraceae bacterium]
MENDTGNERTIEIVETELGMSSGWLIGTGIVTLIVGLAAIILPQIATMTVNIVIGALLIAFGIVAGVNAFRMRHTAHVALRAVGAILYTVAGVALLFFPAAGVVSLTILVGAFLVIAGVDKISFGFAIKPAHNWGWLAFSGLIDLLLAFLIFFLLPQSASWIIGLMVGVSMLFNGLWLLTAGIMGRKSGTEAVTREYYLSGKESYK